MLEIDSVTFRLGGRTILDGASARIPDGHKVGLVGKNGAGKTTLLKLIRGEFSPESGAIRLPAGARLGWVEQEAPASAASLIEVVLAADRERAALLAAIEAESDPGRIGEIHDRLATIGAHAAEARAAAILKGLGFSEEDQRRPCRDFSGGWRMRVALAGVLFAEPDLLLLDEPTNYLDLEGALWLETYLARYPHTVLLVSHDRDLLNRAVGHILHLESGRLALHAGGYDDFERRHAERLRHAAAEARRKAEMKAHLQSFVDRFRAKATKARQAQARLKMIEKLGEIAPPPLPEETRFTFPDPEPVAPPALALEKVAVGHDGRPVLARIDARIDPDDRIALLGANGEGKSTLAALLAGRLAPLEGTITRARKLRVGHFAQHQIEMLDPASSPLDHLAARLPEETEPNLRERLARFGLGAAVADLAAARLSGGQKSRLALLLATLEAPHLLILDEPTNHLDIDSRRALAEALGRWKGALVVVSHDLDFLARTVDRLWLVKGGRVCEYEGDLETYRAMLLAERGTGPKARPARAAKDAPAGPRPLSPAERRRRLAPLRQAVARAEARLEKLEALKARLDAALADPALYENGLAPKAQEWQKRRRDLERALTAAEDAWLEATARLEAEEAALAGGGEADTAKD